MNLLFVLQNGKGVGGGDYSILKFAEHLSKIGHEIIIFTTERNPSTEKLEKCKNLGIFYRRAIPKLFKGSGYLDRIWGSIYQKTKIEPLLEKEGRVDFVIGYHTESSITANKLGKKYHLPAVTFVFETPEWMESQLANRWKKEYKGRFRRLWLKTRKELKTIDIIFPISHKTKIENEKWLKRDIEEPISPGLETIEFNKIKNVKKENQIIYVGRLNAYKNVDILIRALSRLKNPPKLIICGNGEEKEKLYNLANELNVKVDFRGTVSEEEKWNEIKKSLFMVFPTSFEGFGMPPMEALYCGIPCICTDLPVLRDVYKDKVEYFKEYDVEELANKINFLLKNQDYCIKRGREGRNYITSRYSWEKSARKIENTLKNYLISRHKSK